MSGHRQAAVALHALATADRDLILAELPPADQATLRGHLQELRALGFVSTPALLDAASTPPSSASERLAQATPAVMFAIFEHEPATLIAQFLAIREWRWSAGLLALLPPVRRELIRAAGQGAVAPARQLFLMQAVGRRLDEQTGPVGTAPSRSLLTPLLRLVTSWTR